MKSNISLSFLMISVILQSCIEPSPKPDLINQRIDSLFQEWNVEGHPGGSIGVMKDGEIIFSNGYGLASLEYDVPNTDSTLFNIASVSKQFTAYGMAMLESQGKLSLEDDIREYLTELPDFGHKISIRHMLNHTSGMRSLHALLGMAGWRGDDRRTNQDLMRFMVNQKDLNFEPGAEHLYCNTGYIFCSEIIERITGQEFVPWMDENVFTPLGMTNTYVEEEYNQVVPNNATSYNWQRENEEFSRAIPYWGYVGSGNIHTNIHDLMKWLQHLRDPDDRNKNEVEKMFQRGLLNNGDTLNYALGLRINKYKEEDRYGHGGSIGGFRAFTATFPEHELHIVVLTNFSNAGSGKMAMKIADIILNKPSDPDEESPEREELPALAVSNDIVGSYYSPELETTYTLDIKEGELMGEHPRHGVFKIKMVATDTLLSELFAFARVYIVRGENNKIKGVRVTNGRVRNMWFEKR